MITVNQLNEAYIKDLSLPDTFHGRTDPKVRNMSVWKGIRSWYRSSPKAIDIDRAWVWSDTHFGHKNIIKYGERPFDDIQSMHYAMIRDYKSMVQPDDVVLWLGDIGFQSKTTTNEMLNELPGYKIHIYGNHDMDRSGKVTEYDVDERHLCYLITEGGIQLYMTHYPMDHVATNAVNVHGHIHQKRALAHNINVSVECTDYKPVSLRSIMNQAQQIIEAR